MNALVRSFPDELIDDIICGGLLIWRDKGGNAEYNNTGKYAVVLNKKYCMCDEKIAEKHKKTSMF